MPLLPLGGVGIMLSGCPSIVPSVRASWRFLKSQHDTFYKVLGEFLQISSFGTLADKYELITFLGQKSKVKVMTRPDMMQKGGGMSNDSSSLSSHFIFSCLL